MNKKTFKELVGNFDTHDETSVSKMALLIKKYPYFQLPRFFYTKSLKDQNKDDLDNALNQLALYTYDRSILKKSIESTLEYPKKNQELEKAKSIEKIKADKKETIFTEKKPVSPKKKKVALKRINTAYQQHYPTPKNLKLSFIDWIELTEDNKKAEMDIEGVEQINPLNDKLSIINRFIDADPKISPLGKTENYHSVVKEDFYSDELMTETLAKLLVKQKKYKKAISAYKILSLKYPEKNVFFAGQIQKIMNFQQK